MRHISLVVLSVSLVTLAACGKSSSSDLSSDKSKSAAIEPAKAGGGADKPQAGGGGGGGGNDGVAAPPADPLVDGTPLGSCDMGAKKNGCTEHYVISALGDDNDKKFCEGPLEGKWLKGQACPKANRVRVCRTDTERQIGYSTDDTFSSLADQKKLCTETLMGKWGEFPKGK